MLHTGYLGLTYDLEHREEDEKKLSVYIENNLRLNSKIPVKHPEYGYLFVLPQNVVHS